MVKSQDEKKLMERAAQVIRIMHILKKGFDAKASSSIHNNMKDKLTLPQMTVLGFVMHYNTIAIRELAKECNVAMSTMSEMINRLAKLGLVKRNHDKTDRRVIRIELTAKGQKMFEEKYKIAQQGFATLLGHLSEKNQKELITAFQTIEKIIDKTTDRRDEK